MDGPAYNLSDMKQCLTQSRWHGVEARGHRSATIEELDNKMSDRWFYRIFGQEFGPVSLDLVRTLVSSGTIAPDDEVRDASRSNWILACAASELRDSKQPSDAEFLIDRRNARDEWFCQGATGAVGPLKLSDLIQLAADGQLKPDEVVKTRADAYWKQVCSIQRLVDLLPFPGHRTEPSSSSAPAVRVKQDQPEVNGDDHVEDLESLIIRFPGTGSDVGADGTRRVPATFRPLATMDDSDITHNREGVRPRFEAKPPRHPGFDSVPEGWIPAEVDLDDSKVKIRPVSKAEQSRSADDETDLSSRDLDSGNLSEDAKSKARWDQFERTLNIHNSKWSGWIAGKEFGPVDFSELVTWAVSGRLSPMDFVRQGESEPYVPAVYVPSLFTVRATAVSLNGQLTMDNG